MPFRWLLCIYFALFVCLATGQEALAQGAAKRIVSAGRRVVGNENVNAAQIEKILANRSLRTQARQIENLKKGSQYLDNEDFPGFKITGWPSHYDSNAPYGDLPFWKYLSDQAKRDYFLSANNRAGALNLKIKQQAVKDIQKNLPALWNERLQFAPQPFEKLLADVIPANAKYILLGEEHGQSQIQVFLTKFFKEYKAKYPGRKVVLLTEFLPINGKKTLLLQDMKAENPAYAYVLNSAASNGITLKGLEPKYVYFSEGIIHLDPQWAGKEEVTGLWITPEGMRLRNKAWLARIKELRQAYPDAVFMIYAGADHLAYNSFASLASQLPGEEVFVAHLFADTPTDNEARGLLEAVGEDKYPFYLEEVLSWKDASLRRIAGFDIRLLLSDKNYPFKKQK